ncbi:hypothetical protein SAMN05444166_7557 [Singulisphaera sp. GP187]|nr:hypothetical protein SAMN05444166_7557 [Singulisphaera sp. GP187]
MKLVKALAMTSLAATLFLAASSSGAGVKKSQRMLSELEQKSLYGGVNDACCGQASNCIELHPACATYQVKSECEGKFADGVLAGAFASCSTTSIGKTCTVDNLEKCRVFGSCNWNDSTNECEVTLLPNVYSQGWTSCIDDCAPG